MGRPGRFASVALLAAALPLNACAQGPTESGAGLPPEIRALPRPLSAPERALIDAGNTFAFGLLRESATAETGANVFLSPLSASIALSMALAGGEGETLRQMGRTLGFEGLTPEQVATASRELVALLTGLDRGVELSVASSAWLRSGFDVRPGYLSLLRDGFGAPATQLDFASPDAASTINAWVSTRTGGRIPSIVTPPLDPLAMLFLINAVHFKGEWRERFDPTRTRSEPFREWRGAGGGGLVEVGALPLMQRRGRYPYMEDTRLQAVELPYGGNAFAMVLLLPVGTGDPDPLLQSLDVARWNEVLAGLAPREIELALPRLTLEHRNSLIDELKALGMTDPFDPSRADFRGISPGAREAGLHISDVLQRTWLSINEAGTEAAAATSVTVGVTSVPEYPVFRADRPFLLFIRERLTGAILFGGVIRTRP